MPGALRDDELTITAAARLLQLDRAYLWRLIKAQLPYRIVRGNQIVVTRADLQRLERRPTGRPRLHTPPPLTPRAQQLLHLRDVERLRFRAIGAQLGMSATAAKAAYHRAKQRQRARDDLLATA